MGTEQPAGDRVSWDTSLHVRHAIDGDGQSLAWIVARLSPLLLTGAEYRLGPDLRRHIDPEDLVNDAWLVALPKLADMELNGTRATPVLLKYLSTTITHRVSNLLRRQLRRGTIERPSAVDPGGLPADATGVVTRAVRDEARVTVRNCLDELEEQDREIVVLRGIEQNQSKTVAAMLGITASAVDKRFSRAMQRLRGRLPNSVFHEID